MIGKVEILRNYHDHAIVITLSYETKEESLLERVYFKDMKAIEYQ